MLGEISLTQKRRNIVWLHLCEVSRVVQFIGTESRTVVARGKEGMRSECGMGVEFQFGVMTQMVGGDGCTTM